MINYILKYKKFIVFIVVSLFIIILLFFGPQFFVKSLIGLDINEFNDDRLPPINGECYFDQYSFKSWSENNLGQNYEIRYKYKFIDIEKVFQNIKCWGQIQGSNYNQGEEISNLGSYITLTILRIKYIDQLAVLLLLIYIIYYFNWIFSK